MFIISPLKKWFFICFLKDNPLGFTATSFIVPSGELEKNPHLQAVDYLRRFMLKFQINDRQDGNRAFPDVIDKPDL